MFDEEHASREAEHQAAVKTKLDQAVKDGKITQAQEDQIIAKQKELETFKDTLKDKTPEERRTAMKAKMDEFKKWLDDNKISLRDLGVGPGMGMMRGHHGHMGQMDDNGTDIPAPTNDQ